MSIRIRERLHSKFVPPYFKNKPRHIIPNRGGNVWPTDPEEGQPEEPEEPETPPEQPVPAPTLTTLQPPQALQWGTEVRVRGTDFTPNAVVVANGVDSQTTQYKGDTELRDQIPGIASAGEYQVTVRNDDGQESNALTFSAL